jgi:hypothetical protein
MAAPHDMTAPAHEAGDRTRPARATRLWLVLATLVSAALWGFGTRLAIVAILILVSGAFEIFVPPDTSAARGGLVQRIAWTFVLGGFYAGVWTIAWPLIRG